MTPTTRWPKPNAKRVSVIAGEVEMIRFENLKLLLPAQSEDVERIKKRSKVGKTVAKVVLIFVLVRLDIKNFTGILSFQRNEGTKL